MKFFKTCLISIFSLGLLFIISCSNDDGVVKTGMGEVTMNISGTIDPDHKFLLTFSDLVGIQDYPHGVEVSANESVALEFPRVGEILSIYISNIPTNCPDISSSSSTGNQLGFNDNPSNADHPEAEYESIFLVPLDGSQGKLEFTIGCN